MDANGTRFHLLLGQDDWASCSDASAPARSLATHFATPPSPCTDSDRTTGFAWDKEHAALTLRPCVVRFDAATADQPPPASGSARRGAARDRFGNIYWIADSSADIRVIPAATGGATHFWSPGDGLTCEHEPRYGEFHAIDSAAPPPIGQLSGLAITEEHYLVVGVLDPPGLLVFDLHAGGSPQQLTWPLDVPGGFVPFDLAPRPGGGIWVLDRAARRYWALDRHFAVDTLNLPTQRLESGAADDFQPLDPGPIRRTAARVYPTPVAINAIDPIAIEGLPDGSVLILDAVGASAQARLVRDGVNQQFGSAQPLVDLDAYDIVFVGGPSTKGRLYAASRGGNQGYAYDLAQNASGEVTLTLVNEYLPMRLFGGKGLIASTEQALYDFFDGWVPLVKQRRPRYAPSAALLTPIFDGREPNCVWHRLMIDACLPHDATLRVRTRAADELSLVPTARWHEEPEPYLRRDGSELPFVDTGRGEREGTWELLFQRARGRHLQIELTLTGNERVTPRVHGLRAYYPRFSYLEHYVPAVYREDETSASFLDRFLANTEGFFTATEDRIAAVQTLFDARSAPTEALDWLAGWFGVALDPSWGEPKRRMFIRHAPDFFQMRGTTRGLQAAIRLAVDDCADESIFEPQPRRTRGPDSVRLVESWRARRMPAVVAGDPTGDVGIRIVPAAQRWSPRDTRAQLNDRYRAWLAANGNPAPATAEFPVVAPANAADAQRWRAFAVETLGFVPSANALDTAAWREFLGHRYTGSGAFEKEYGGASLASALLPRTLPRDGAPLLDWFEFERVVIATRRTAHRFSVLLPVPRGGDITTKRLERLDLVRRVVGLEKPAHTVFDVKFYWGLFRVGEARLGDDTLIDRGGRSPDLLPPLRLGQAYLAETHLAPVHPFDVAQRRIVGRDPLSTSDSEEARA